MRGLASVLACVVPVLVHLVRRLERKATVARRASLGRFVGSVIGASLLLLGLGSAQPAAADCASGYVGGRAGSCGYDAATTLRVAGTVAADGSCVALGDSRILAVPPQEHANGTSTTPSTRKVATNSGAVAKYDPDFALGQITSGGRASASQLDQFGAAQGWTRSQTATGPIKYTDANGVVRITIKQGSPRAPGSATPHVEIRNAAGQRVDAYGNPVTRRSPGNHTPIDWDLGS